jgi:hypothetical protein
MEFTFDTYKKMLAAFLKNNYRIYRVDQFFNKRDDKILFLRHDVDRFPNNALKMARIENELGIQSTYYFRTIKSVFVESIIKNVVSLGHEIGYHYEDLALCNGDKKVAILNFKDNLEKLRSFYSVNTICMHGSPLSKWDNKTIWEKNDFHKYGIILDTSLSINYDEVFYITDNGFGWNKTAASIRDKVKSNYNIPIKNTARLIDLLTTSQMPAKVFINTHPDTFFDFGMKWFLNYSMIKSKNVIKRVIVKTDIYKQV